VLELRNHGNTHTLAAVVLGAAGFFSVLVAVVGAAPFWASLTGPEGPFGRENSPLFSPDAKLWLMYLANAASVVVPRSLFF